MQNLVIDWELAIQVAGNNRETAKELFSLLIKNLPDNLKEIKICLHKLHGALCYCGTPRLKTATANFEKAIDNKQYDQITTLLTKLEIEVNELMKSAKSS
jgi:two-component system sensor histidine kinase BarA